MSWSASALVVDGDTHKLEEVFESQRQGDYYNNDEMENQKSFVIETIQNAFETEVVEGAYNVYCGGHSDSSQENDRKSLNISMTPTEIPAESGDE